MRPLDVIAKPSRLLVGGLAVVLMAQPGVAHSDGDASPDWGYFFDGGAIPFVYGSLVVAAGALLLAEPPSQPRLFDSNEGGAEPHPEAIPDYQVALLSGASLGVLASFDRDARWFHFKGFVESVVTTAAVTEVSKNAFGRHRPSYDAASSTEDDRKSFFSGHGSITWSSLTYLGLYMHDHVYASWRGADSFAWWEAPALGSLAALAIYVPWTRVHDNKHHVSDVLTGAALGTGMSLGFYTWQEHRFRRAMTHDVQEARTMRLRLAPMGQAGLQVLGRF